jgi:uncharacterized protein (TIGR02145 family)
MKKRTDTRFLLLALAIFSVPGLNAQNYQITFTGSGASTSVSTVKVENLTSGATLTVNGTDILELSLTTGVNSPLENQFPNFRIYPNPMTDYTTLVVYPPVRCDATITVNEISGKSVVSVPVQLENISQAFRLSGLGNGLYIINVKSNGFQYSGKLVVKGTGKGSVKIEKTNSVARLETNNRAKALKSAEATVNMAYKTDDLLKFTGASGNYRTIIMDTPTSSKVINFNFVACMDGDYNIYPVVVIGTQTWMAANLKATKYNDGTGIPNVTDNTAWSALSSAAYCDYSNTPAFSNTYGRLYNWYAVASTNLKNACPVGWHVATNAEWTTLSTYLGGDVVSAGKLKETGINNWANPNVATNETGFTALPGGYRAQSGTFGLMGTYGFWWSATISGTTYAWYRYMFNSTGNNSSGDNDQHAGFSVRCLKD